jgi:hypothetical protein
MSTVEDQARLFAQSHEGFSASPDSFLAGHRIAEMLEIFKSQE